MDDVPGHGYQGGLIRREFLSLFSIAVVSVLLSTALNEDSTVVIPIEIYVKFYIFV